jgi:hypothetical protein
MWMRSRRSARYLANAQHATQIDCTRGEMGQTSELC